LKWYVVASLSLLWRGPKLRRHGLEARQFAGENPTLMRSKPTMVASTDIVNLLICIMFGGRGTLDLGYS
jgi:hypothetical protein